MKNTLNYNLKLPEYADIADIADLNYNAKTIDAELMAKVNKTALKTEQLTNTDTDILTSSASNKLFENGVGGDVLGYIEDGATHAVNTIWLSKTQKGEFKCLVGNSDNYINAAKWLQIDDVTNAGKLQNLEVAKFSKNNQLDILSNAQITFSTGNSDLNLVTVPFCYFTSESINAPPGLGCGYIITFTTGNYASQLAIANNVSKVATRCKNNGNWLAWVNL